MTRTIEGSAEKENNTYVSDQEKAEVLGFSSIEQMKDHQKWLNNQKAFRDELRKRVRTSGDVIDLNKIDNPASPWF